MCMFLWVAVVLSTYHVTQLKGKKACVGHDLLHPQPVMPDPPTGGELPVPLQPILQHRMTLVLQGVGVLHPNLVDLLLREIQLSGQFCKRCRCL